MNLLKYFIRNVSYPFWMLYDGNRRTLKYIKLYKNFDHFQGENRLKESQKNGLKRILIHAYETTDYYKDLFTRCRLDPFNFKDVSELEKLPLLDKNIIKKNVSRMISSRVPKVDLLKDSTGGSTGVPLEFYRDRECIRKRKGQELFFDRWMGGTK